MVFRYPYGKMAKQSFLNAGVVTSVDILDE